MEFFAKTFDELTTTELYEILKSRAQIFMIEQKIYCLDMDDIDYKAMHFFLKENEKTIAYLRAYYYNEEHSVVKIGRVLSVTHKKGLGRELMNNCISYIRDNMKCEKIFVSSQCQAMGFYEKCGFKTVSDEYLEEGVPHIAMELYLK